MFTRNFSIDISSNKPPKYAGIITLIHINDSVVQYYKINDGKVKNRRQSAALL